MSKPLELEASLDMTDEEDQVLIEIQSTNGEPLSPQVILDAVADMLTTRFNMVPEDWEIDDDRLDS